MGLQTIILTIIIYIAVYSIIDRICRCAEDIAKVSAIKDKKGE